MGTGKLFSLFVLRLAQKPFFFFFTSMSLITSPNNSTFQCPFPPFGPWLSWSHLFVITDHSPPFFVELFPINYSSFLAFDPPFPPPW